MDQLNEIILRKFTAELKLIISLVLRRDTMNKVCLWTINQNQ